MLPSDSDRCPPGLRSFLSRDHVFSQSVTGMERSLLQAEAELAQFDAYGRALEEARVSSRMESTIAPFSKLEQPGSPLSTFGVSLDDAIGMRAEGGAGGGAGVSACSNYLQLRL